MSSRKNNAWIQKIKQCAKEYQEEKKQMKDTKTPAKTSSTNSSSNKSSTKSKYEGKSLEELKNMDPPEGLKKSGFMALINSKIRLNNLVEASRNGGVGKSSVNNANRAKQQIRSKIMDIKNYDDIKAIADILNKASV
jgi:hypothetical protein